MSKLIISIFSILICTIGFAQKNKYKELEQRLVILNYTDSTVKCEIMITPKEIKVADMLEYFWYYSDELKSNIGGYSGFPLHGKYNVFDLQNNLIVEGHFKDGVKNHTWKRWTSEGKLILSQEWKNGLPDGESIVYDENGNKILYTEYKAGHKSGKQISYSDGEETIVYYDNNEITDEKSFFGFLSKKDTSDVEPKKEKVKKEPKKKKESQTNDQEFVQDSTKIKIE